MFNNIFEIVQQNSLLTGVQQLLLSIFIEKYFFVDFVKII